MRVSKPCNLSLLNIIAEAKEITYNELRAKHLPPKQPGIIPNVTTMFDFDLKVLESEGRISIDGEVIRFIRK